MTYIEFAVVREAHKIQTTLGYKPEGAAFTIQWAYDIAFREENGIPRVRPTPTRKRTGVGFTPTSTRVLYLRKARARLRVAIKAARDLGATQSVRELEEFYDANYR